MRTKRKYFKTHMTRPRKRPGAKRRRQLEQAARLAKSNARTKNSALERLAVLDPARYGPSEKEEGKGGRKKNR